MDGEGTQGLKSPEAKRFCGILKTCGSQWHVVLEPLIKLFSVVIYSEKIHSKQGRERPMAIAQ